MNKNDLPVCIKNSYGGKSGFKKRKRNDFKKVMRAWEEFTRGSAWIITPHRKNIGLIEKKLNELREDLKVKNWK